MLHEHMLHEPEHFVSPAGFLEGWALHLMVFIFLSPETGWFSGKTTDLHILNQQDTLLFWELRSKISLILT